LPFILIKKEQTERPKPEKEQEHNYAIMSARCLAPTKIQFLLSSFVFCMTAIGMEACLLLKTLVFLSFYSSHVIKATADFKPSGQAVGDLVMACQY
jgi:hypothetical protein